MRSMTDIIPAAEAARETARQASGQFGEQQHSAPDMRLIDPRTPLPIIVTAMLTKRNVVPYPAELPPGGEVTADLEDSGGVYVSIEFKDQLDEAGAPIRISLGGDDEYGSGNDWNSVANGDPGFSDDALNDHALRYLRDLHTVIDGDAEAVRYAATQPHMDTLVKRATEPEPERDYSDEAWTARMQKRGEQLIGAFADPGHTLEDNAADAVADILAYAKAKGIDIDDITRRAISYNEED